MIFLSLPICINIKNINDNMKTNNVKEDINFFNENKSKEVYSKLLEKYNVYADRCKCRECGEDIFYQNTKLKTSRKTIALFADRGYSHLTTRVMNDTTYHLSICEDCLYKKYPELINYPNKGRLFMAANKYTQYAFNIPEDVLKEFSKNKNGNKEEKFIKKYGEEEGKAKWQSYCKNLALTEEKFIKKYGEEEGKIRWQSYCNKQAITNTFEYKHEKYGWTKEQFDEYNKSRAVTLENMIKKYGEEEGLKKFNNYSNRQRYTNTLEYFIITYGEEEGLKKWENFNNSRLNIGTYSKISQDLFNRLISLNPDIFLIDHEIYYADLNYEYECLMSDGKLYYLDFYDKTLNICIEFNGEAFHPNPQRYKEDDIFKCPFDDSGIPAKYVWEKENKRYNDLKNEYGIHTIVVWESDYNKSPENVIKYIINEILKIIK